MKLEELPLLDLFNSLRQRHGLPLGVDEYLTALRSLQAGFGAGSRQDIERLCCLVWAKSEEESRLVRRLFEQLWQPAPAEWGREENCFSDRAETLPDPETPDEALPETPEPEVPLADEPSEREVQPSLTPEPVQAVQAVRSSRQNRALKRPRYSLLNDYFPVTRRQMKQSWRSLRRPVREGVPSELDVEATVAKIGREGLLLEPVLVPPRINRTDLVLMLDWEGSMVPFHALSQQLAETARRGGRLGQTRVFYFHDYPDRYLYRHPAWLDAQPVAEVLAEVGERAAVLIVSDGGAARGNFDRERVKGTRAWIAQLQQSVRYCAWLNPMPSVWWPQTTAGAIARLLPMFEMSRQGMNAAIRVLRGRYYLEKGEER